MKDYIINNFPKSRIATIDVCEAGRKKHHVIVMIELDVTLCRERLRIFNRNNPLKISFNGWLISVISTTLKKHASAASFLIGKSKQIIFDDINVSLLVEKKIKGQRVPMPLLITKADKISAVLVTQQIENARYGELSEKDIVLQKQSGFMEQLYYYLPQFARRWVWQYLLRHPKIAFSKMGNVAFTSIGMMGKVNGWFIPTSVHPICFGMSSIIKKPVVIDDAIVIREMLNMTILLDHDVIDGAPMARFISDLVKNIESGNSIGV
jgi:pyruvate/2-oxoglutarate dehydrogenase complex dihydrolipoamide acyltransferase (E2) component